MSELWTYSPEEIQILLGGVYPLEGYVDGSFVNISKDIMPFSSKRASDGSVGRVYHRNDDYTVRLTLMGQSPSNDILTKLWQLDEFTQRGKFPIMIKDSIGSSFFHSTTAWIKNIPPLEYSNGIPQRQWTLQSSQSAINIGGNEDASDAIDLIVNTITSVLPSIEGII